MAKTKKKFKPEKSCFIIMPLSKSKENPGITFLTLYEDLFEPAILNYQGLYTYKCDKALMDESGMITPFILERVAKSFILIADITDYNPNVLWELGVRHSFIPFGTILICQENRDNSHPVIPFDLKDMNTIFYSTYLTNAGTAEFFNRISSCLNKFEANQPIDPDKLDSPIYRFNIGNLKTIQEKLPKLEEDKRMLEDKLSEIETPANIKNLEDWIFTLEELCQENKIDMPANRPLIRSEGL